MLVFPSHMLILATHYGLFRSQDGGVSWQEVAGGSNQPMDGLMTYSLVYSPLDPQRLYVLTLPTVVSHAGAVGLYTSADEGRTWKLSIAAASITSSTIFTITPATYTPDQEYTYLPQLLPTCLNRSLT